ncbi:MAG: phosphoglycerate dehydrogenase [Planctomycetota bacterium]
MTQKTSFPKNKIRVLLLEDLHPDGIKRLENEGFSIDSRLDAMDDAELLAAIKTVHILGIRSKTQLNEAQAQAASRLLAVGAFCIGVNQIDTDACASAGIPVFNAPFSNTRSVAELVIADIIMLFRGLLDKIMAAHHGEWRKDASGSVEVRGKTLGIVGYGHIGRQVSVLAEALGMRVLYYDVVDKLSMGNAERMPDLQSLLSRSDVVTMHVPGEPETRKMISAREIGWMKPGAFLINTSRGSVVDIDALAAALNAGKLGGAAADVFPSEPKSKDSAFISPLIGLPNVILTPHIGGSTVEAQRNIGIEVASKLARFVNNGSTEGAVNFPNVVLPEQAGRHRILHIHRNVFGVMSKVNELFGAAGINIASQYLRTLGEIGYLIMDVEKKATSDITKKLAELPETIKVRTLF